MPFLANTYGDPKLTKSWISWRSYENWASYDHVHESVGDFLQRLGKLKILVQYENCNQYISNYVFIAW